MNHLSRTVRLGSTALMAWIVIHGCSDGAIAPVENVAEVASSTTSLALKMTDTQGHPLANAIISTHSATHVSDALGLVLLDNLPSGRFVGHIEAEGFAPASAVVQLPEGAQTGYEVRLVPLAKPIPFDVQQGGSIESPDGVRITLPPNGLVNETGEVVQGSATITITPLDPTNALTHAPAPFVGVAGTNDVQVGLEALYLADVSLWKDGHRLQLAPGKTAAIEFVLPPAIAAKHVAGDVVPAWWLDVNAGVWRKDVEGTIQASTVRKGALSWSARVNHFTWWGSLEPWTEKNCFRVKVEDSLGKAQGNVQLLGVGTSYKGFSTAVFTNSAGEACVDIKRGGTANIYAGSLYETLVPPLSVTGAGPASACGGFGAACASVTMIVPNSVCVPNSTRVCVYTGPAGTENVGPCHAGMQVCNGYGKAWSPCYGEVVPVAENCTTAADDNCDGMIPPVDDNNECTADVCDANTGLITHSPVPLGTACAGMGMICNGAGICGNCNTAADCPGQDDACKTRTCTGGLCGFANSPAGTACNDDNPCTQNEVCSSGTCGGGTAVVCPDNGLCVVGVCDPQIGCTDAPKTNGTACNDYSDCTQVDTCQSGVCVGSMGCALGTTCVNNACVVGACPGTLGLPGRPQWKMPYYATAGMVMADFNIDGKIDFATAFQSVPANSSFYVGVALGLGGGEFNSSLVHTPATASFLALGDINGDAIPDLLGGGPYIANDKLKRLINQGNGSFAVAGMNHSLEGAWAGALADMTGDGSTDILVSRTGPNATREIAILANQGSSIFPKWAAVNTGANYADRIRVADIDGDGKLDIVFHRESSVLMGISYQNAGGTFTTPYDYSGGGSYNNHIGIADFNNDGKLDVVSAGSNLMDVYTNQGNRLLMPIRYWAPGLGPSIGSSNNGVETADIDNDGDVDIVLASSSGLLEVFKNQGNGLFNPEVMYWAGVGSTSPHARDMNNDGMLDIVVSNSSALRIAYNEGNGIFGKPVTMYAAGSKPTTLAVGDLNDDGKPDVVVPNELTSMVSMLLNDGMGGFLPPVTLQVGSYPKGVTLSDVNGDGRSDIVTANEASNDVSVRLNQGNATFAVAVNYPAGSYPNRVTAADMTGDGKLDLAVVNTSANTVNVLLNQGNGSLGAATPYLVGSRPVAIAANDLNGDGKADLAVAHSLNAELRILLNQGNGTFAPSVAYTVGTEPAAVAIGDVNGDGKPDVVVTNAGSQSVSVLLNQGNGLLVAATNYAAELPDYYGMATVSLMDMNGDGHLDIVTPRYGVATVFLNQGNGTFAPNRDYPIGYASDAIVLADMNSDGRPDMVSSSKATQSVEVFLNKCLP